MSNVERFQSLILLAAIIVGMLLGNIPLIEEYAENFVTPFLFVMLFGVFLNTPLQDFKRAFRNIRFSITTVVINFVWTPLLVILLGRLFLADSPVMQIGFLMLMVTPCTDWYLIFTGIAKGNVPLSATVLPVNLVLQIVLLPVYLSIVGGASGTVDISALLGGIFFMLLLPFVLARITRVFLDRLYKEPVKKKVLAVFSSLQTVLLACAIMAMFASKGTILLENMGIVALLIIPILLFYVINFVLAQVVGRLFHYTYEDTASLTLTTIAKNSPMTLGIALIAFPNEPVIHLIMLVEPLIELPSMMIITKVLLLLRKRKAAALQPAE